MEQQVVRVAHLNASADLVLRAARSLRLRFGVSVHMVGADWGWLQTSGGRRIGLLAVRRMETGTALSVGIAATPATWPLTGRRLAAVADECLEQVARKVGCRNGLVA